MYQRIRCCRFASGLELNGVRIRGLKTFSPVSSGAENHKFIAPWMKQHLFNSEKHNAATDLETEHSDFSNSKESYVLPNLVGPSIQSHVHEIAERQSAPYRELLEALVTTECPSLPDEWLFQPGWICYRKGSEPEHVEFPNEDALFFDAEVCVSESFAPVLATAVSSTAWYAWVSPVLIQRRSKVNAPVYVSDLVPLGHQGTRPRVVIGHYVCYDSARIQECYDLSTSGMKFFDTMAAHISVSGITDLQRYFLLNAEKKPDWASLACGNSLKALHHLYCGKELDKTERDVFVKGSISDIADRFQELTRYCALDVVATHSVYCKLLPLFLERCSHGSTLTAMLDISSMFVPVTRQYKDIIDNVKEKISNEDKKVQLLLQELADDALHLMQNDKFKDDPWMWDQDWRKISKKLNKPEWYKKLTSQVSKTESDIHLNLRSNISAQLMQLSWGCFPLHYENDHGWGMLLPAFKAASGARDQVDGRVPVESIRKHCDVLPRPRISSIPSLRDYESLQSGVTASNSDVSSGAPGFKNQEGTQFFMQNGLIFKKLPHYLSIDKNVGGPMSIHLLMNPCLRSNNSKATSILKILRKNLFWKRNSKAFEMLPVVWYDESQSSGAVVPSASACGDFARHPKEVFFSAFCSEPECSAGTEVNQAFEAPPRWSFLSATVPDTNLWMTCLLADSVSGECGHTPIGKMFVDGEVYSSISEHMKLTKLQSELLFHAVLWGANKRYLAKMLREINPLLSDVKVYKKADQLLTYLCGSPFMSQNGKLARPGGIFDDFLLKLQEMIESEKIATPILKTRLSRVLESDRKKYLKLIQNWLVRSSAVDYLHVLMMCFRDLEPSARLCSVGSLKMHVKYLVPDESKYCAAKSLHIAHLYAAAFCAAQVGLSDIPKIAAELPHVTLSSHFREDSINALKLTFKEALMYSKPEFSTNN
ncbi:DNA polymerase subunit gamma-1, mitochondrial-like [Thrips palmi]|uniref:DNA polymerase subunit gamma-1, mitochondrial-like n=1 Tax=Thrips palmi TaxID=161013 RepID=A0A6P8ZM52_THRPL|nr:DNA polymerase subunit gamma-1, mitochondrial-like [Thrips palmi]